jgi:hypothetical protein
VWLLQSRSRPHNLARFARAWCGTAASTEVLIRIDDDDPLAASYAAMDMPCRWTVMQGRRLPFAAMFNEIFARFPDRAWYGLLADDILPQTQGWDRILVEAAGKDGLAYGDDGINGAALATHFAVAGDLVRTVGWLALPGLQRLYIDTVWNDIARARGTLRYRCDVKLTHLHFSNRRAPVDGMYRKPGRAADKAIYDAWRSNRKEG